MLVQPKSSKDDYIDIIKVSTEHSTKEWPKSGGRYSVSKVGQDFFSVDVIYKEVHGEVTFHLVIDKYDNGLIVVDLDVDKAGEIYEKLTGEKMSPYCYSFTIGGYVGKSISIEECKYIYEQADQ